MTTMHPSDGHYRGQTLRLPDLAVVSDVIDGVTFENCILEGPAVVFMSGDDASMKNNTFEGDSDALFWVVPDGRTRVIGAIALVNCHLLGCVIRRVGLAVPASDYETFRAGFGFSD